MSGPLSVFATISPKPAHLTEAEAAILAIVQRTRAEPGCRRFDLLQPASGQGQLYLYEEWDDEAALERHYAMDYTRAVFARYESWLEKPAEVLKLRSVARA